MQQNNLLREEKRKLLSLVNYEYVSLDFSKLTSVLDNNLSEPRWMNVYVWLYKSNLPSDIVIYNILLEKLSKPMFLFYFINEEKRYVVNANELVIREYVRYLITNETKEMYIKAQYIPHKDYIKEINKLAKFSEIGITLKHIRENKFILEPINLRFENIDEAQKIYDDLLDVTDFYKNVNVDRATFLANYDTTLKLGKDKRMLATISNITTYFNCKFDIIDDKILLKDTNVYVDNEESATTLQTYVIDAYHFYRNVINAVDKKDIISEIYNKKVSPEILKDYEENIASYINILGNRELIDWIITISKESRYTLNIRYDDQGIFYIEDAIIITPLDAKEYYIDYMDRKKEKLAVAIYKNTILNRIKNAWNKLRAKFAKV